MANPYAAYNTVQRDVLSSRQIQARILREAARKLKTIQEKWDIVALNEALNYNWKIWTLVQADAIDEKCPLPEPLRNNLIRLSSYVDKTTIDIMCYPEPGKLSSLISINNNIATGLEN